MWNPVILLLLSYNFIFVNPEKTEAENIVEYINSLQTTWKADYNFDKHIPLSQLRKLIDTHKSSEPLLPVKASQVVKDLPDNFDARVQWPQCPSIPEIREQGYCISSWAESSTAAMSDRICIHSNGQIKDIIGAQHLLACCIACGEGCNGGNSHAAWDYWVKKGLVTGGEYNSTEGCQPYETPPCDHYVNGSYPYCAIGYGDLTSSCVVGSCTNSFYKTSYLDDLHFGDTAYQILEYPDLIQDEIYQNGPVSARFDVYDDFYYYKSGVYVRKSKNYVGTHAVKILGWGVEDGTPYWLTANSWNTDWGDKGYFKIFRGNNECGIEQTVFAGMPKFN